MRVERRRERVRFIGKRRQGTYVVGDGLPGIVAGHARGVGGWVAAAADDFGEGRSLGGGGEGGQCDEEGR